RLARQASESELVHAAEHLHQRLPRIRVETLVNVGDPAETIVALARERFVRLIVLASHGRGASPAHPVLGSVAERVARATSSPVLIVQPGDEAPEPVQRLVVPLDGSELAERQPPVARAIARRCDLPVRFLNVVDAAEGLVPPLGGDVDRLRFDEFIAGCHAAAAKLLEGHGARCLQEGITASWDVADGPAAATILDALADGDLLILSSHGQRSLRQWSLGSVAEKLIHHGRAHVLLLPAPPEADPAEASPP
ncbi:MAG TPA: universal stress protein, partial [Thermomicrobiales bacterium]|nr:universal stress protein [Thermomicrobiales bacterium]